MWSWARRAPALPSLGAVGGGGDEGEAVVGAVAGAVDGGTGSGAVGTRVVDEDDGNATVVEEGARPVVSRSLSAPCRADPAPRTTSRTTARTATVTLARRGQCVSRSCSGTSLFAGDAVAVPVQLGAVSRLTPVERCCSRCSRFAAVGVEGTAGRWRRRRRWWWRRRRRCGRRRRRRWRGRRGGGRRGGGRGGGG